MIEYHKIQTVYLRNPDTNYRTLLEGQWATPEFEALCNCDWLWTEKINGTNIRVMLNEGKVTFGGRTDNAQIPAFLLSRLQDLFKDDKLTQVFGEASSVCLYGEGFGTRIQKGGGNYIPDGVDFILFDVQAGGLWLRRDDVADIAFSLGIQVVPVVGSGPLPGAIEKVRRGFRSAVARNECLAEGLVMRPCVELLDRRSRRIITKIKHTDFAAA